MEIKANLSQAYQQIKEQAGSFAEQAGAKVSSLQQQIKGHASSFSKQAGVYASSLKDSASAYSKQAGAYASSFNQSARAQASSLKNHIITFANSAPSYKKEAIITGTTLAAFGVFAGAYSLLGSKAPTPGSGNQGFCGSVADYYQHGYEYHSSMTPQPSPSALGPLFGPPTPNATFLEAMRREAECAKSALSSNATTDNNATNPKPTQSPQPLWSPYSPAIPYGGGFARNFSLYTNENPPSLSQITSDFFMRTQEDFMEYFGQTSSPSQEQIDAFVQTQIKSGNFKGTLERLESNLGTGRSLSTFATRYGLYNVIKDLIPAMLECPELKCPVGSLSIEKALAASAEIRTALRDYARDRGSEQVAWYLDNFEARDKPPEFYAEKILVKLQKELKSSGHNTLSKVEISQLLASYLDQEMDLASSLSRVLSQIIVTTKINRRAQALESPTLQELEHELAVKIARSSMKGSGDGLVGLSIGEGFTVLTGGIDAAFGAVYAGLQALNLTKSDNTTLDSNTRRVNVIQHPTETVATTGLIGTGLATATLWKVVKVVTYLATIAKDYADDLYQTHKGRQFRSRRVRNPYSAKSWRRRRR